MAKKLMAGISTKERVIVIVALLVFVIDRITKMLAKEYLGQGKIVDLLLFKFRYSTNTGGAFSILKDHSLLLTILGIIAFFALVYLLRKSSDKPMMTLAKGLIFGGAAGNLLDRIFVRHVIDFIDVGFWPIFNVADMALTIGVMLVLLYLIKKRQ
ncbi:signal peptidase II [Candidatus Woesearchaeota archaeon CG11_big_fil_rev_8_21_14_0_20_43_8]|nr:MAG: signal peptidase II [Candidatus Woesearchaeota archaeon CG11_big_fil_rev_8_21_14_0_20_43_8]PIO05689.1 MAG: signal peptidase II [Candidatus Woesearchaeota archaeon CG08_land_8_20_14_0_20_43_7]